MILFCYKWVQGDPYLEAVNLNFIFTWGDGETEDRAKVSTSPLFKGSSINNDELRDSSIKVKCMAMRTWLDTKRKIQKSYDTRLLETFPFRKK